MDVLTVDRAYPLAYGSGVVVERPGRGLVRLTGPQRVWFLQNTVTAEVDDVPSGRWVESCFLDAKGHLVAQCRVGVLDEEILLDVESGGTANLVDWFVRYRFRTKVEIEDISTACSTFAVLGPPCEDGTVSAGPAFHGRLGDVAVTDIRASGFEGDLPRAGAGLYEVLRIEAGLGAFGVDFGPANLPQEAGLTRVVSVTKGCYIGQEVMARLHFRGHANRSVRRLDFRGVDGDLVGSALFRGDERVGAVSSFAVSPQNGPIGIGMVRLAIDEGETVRVDGGGEALVGPVPEGTKRP